MKTLQEKAAELKRLNDEQVRIIDSVGDRAFTADERKSMREAHEKIEVLEAEVKEMQLDENHKKAARDRNRDLNTVANGLGFLEEVADRKGERPKSFGEQFVSNPEMKSFLEKVSKSNQNFGTSPQVEMKAIITGLSDTSAGSLVTADRDNAVDYLRFVKPLTLRDLVTTIRTTSDLVEFVRMTAFTNAAAPVAEATTISDGAKPASSMALEVVQETVKNIAHIDYITRRALADAPQVMDIVNYMMRYGLEETLNTQMITGSGSGENLRGVLNQTGISTQAFDTDILTTARKARTKVKTLGRATPTAYVMNPSDWEAFDLTQDAEARYYFGGPTSAAQPRLWGVPVIEDEGMTAGTLVVADWKLARLYDRQQATVYISDSNRDLFERNILTILAELRVAFGLVRPQAFVTGDLTA
jgi:HK97 family phage major capsid protein